jgi:hypothetical protein
MAKEPVGHDEAPSVIVDHPFDPKAEWWSLCKVCNLARAAHFSSTPEAAAEMQAHFRTLPRAVSPAEAMKRERERIHQGGRARIGYVADDDDD